MLPNVILIGFMGAGKSLVAKMLAPMLKRNVVSTDELIVQREGRSITEIFQVSGECAFRDIEQKVVAEICEQRGIIIDCGGGVVLNGDNVANLRKNGLLFYLSAAPDVLYHRVKNHTDRPLLHMENPEKRIAELLEQRLSAYEQADYTIITDNKSANDVCDEIISILKCQD